MPPGSRSAGHNALIHMHRVPGRPRPHGAAGIIVAPEVRPDPQHALFALAAVFRIHRLAAPAGAAALVLALLLLPLPLPGTRLADAAQWLAHTLLFGALTWIVQRSTGMGLLRIWVGMATLGAGSELLQLLVGRQASVIDLLHNLLGITAAVLLSAGARHRTWRGALATGCMLLAAAPLAWNLVAYSDRNRQFPVLFSYDSVLDLHFLERSGTTRRRVWPARCEDGSLRVPLDARRFAGILLHEPVADWHAKSRLKIQLSTAGDEPLELTVRVHDEQHDWTYSDRFNEQIVLAPASVQTIAIPLERIRDAPRGRKLDMTHVAGVAVFRANPGPASAFCLRLVLLE
jgi:VanZ family protein